MLTLIQDGWRETMNRLCPYCGLKFIAMISCKNLLSIHLYQQQWVNSVTAHVAECTHYLIHCQKENEVNGRLSR